MEKIPQQDSDQEKFDKQSLWEKEIALLSHIEGDLPIDENIKETIAALNLNGIHTQASCGGHAIQERKTGDTPYPWILIASPDHPRGFSEKNKTTEDLLLFHARATTFLDEFYKNREAEEDIRVKVTDAEHGQFHLSTLVDDDLKARRANEQLTEEEKNDLVAKLPKRQKEMEEFGQFLKAKFLSQDSE